MFRPILERQRRNGLPEDRARSLLRSAPAEPARAGPGRLFFPVALRACRGECRILIVFALRSPEIYLSRNGLVVLAAHIASMTGIYTANQGWIPSVGLLGDPHPIQLVGGRCQRLNGLRATVIT